MLCIKLDQAELNNQFKPVCHSLMFCTDCFCNDNNIQEVSSVAVVDMKPLCVDVHLCYIESQCSVVLHKKRETLNTPDAPFNTEAEVEQVCDSPRGVLFFATPKMTWSYRTQ